MMRSLINEEVKAFKVQAYHNGAFEEITREDILGHWSVFFFYPADFTFVCPTELGDLQDFYEAFQECGCEIYSVSMDTHFVHKAWADASDTIKKIEYPMLADPTGELAKFFGVRLKDLGIGRNAEELLRKVQAAQYVEEHGEQVCPANWKPGEETLMPSLDLVGML